MAPRHIGLLAALSAIWGGSYLLIKYALEDFSAPMIVWARTAIAAVVLAVMLRGAVRGALADMATGTSDKTEVLEATCCRGSNLFVSDGAKADAVRTLVEGD